MSIKELKGLTPWQWDRNNAPNASIGRKWLDEFAQVSKQRLPVLARMLLAPAQGLRPCTLCR
jgi:hypothetical protein